MASRLGVQLCLTTAHYESKLMRYKILKKTHQTAPVNSVLTLISPSAEPVTKNSSPGSIARHLIGDSCAWNR
jgi:hypothetical protein